MDELDIADMEIIDIFDGNELSDEKKNDSNSNFFEEYCSSIKSSHFYKLYQNCPDRMATPELQKNPHMSSLNQEHLRRYPRLNRWANKIKDYVCSEKTLLSKEDVRLLLEDMKSDKLPSFSNFSKKRYSYYNEIHPKGDPNRRVTTPESTLEKMPGHEFLNFCEDWSTEVKLRGNKNLLEFISSNEFPNWLIEPDKIQFENEKDYAIAFKFYFYLVNGLQKKEEFKYEISPIPYHKLVEFYKERQKLIESSKKKEKFPLKIFFLWCQQADWEKEFEKKKELDFATQKKKSWADQIKNFKNLDTYKCCPVAIRPKTPEINEINLNSKSDKVVFKPIHNWRSSFDTLVPHEKKPLWQISKEDMKKFKQSDLWKRYQEARTNLLVEKIGNPYRSNEMSLEDWKQVFSDWKAKFQEALSNVDTKSPVNHFMKPVHAFKETMWYKNCKDRPKTPELGKNDPTKIDVWKEAICIQYPRLERPLDIVKMMDCQDWDQSYILRDYLRFTNMLKITPIDLSLNPKKFKTIEEWDKNLENIKMKTKKALDAIDMDQVQQSKKSKDSKYGAGKYGTTDTAMKNTFRYRRADFRQSRAYEKFEILTYKNSYPRPPTPIFDDFESALEANQALTSWMESIYKKYPRSDWPLFLCQDEDMEELSNSELLKDYQKLRAENLVSKRKTVIKGNNFQYETIEDWDNYLLWYIKSLKESVETALDVKKESQKELSALKVVLPEPVKLSSKLEIPSSNDSAIILLPKPCAIKRKSVDGPSYDLDPVKKLRINEKGDSNHFIKKEVKEELLEEN